MAFIIVTAVYTHLQTDEQSHHVGALSTRLLVFTTVHTHPAVLLCGHRPDDGRACQRLPKTAYTLSNPAL